MDLLDTLDLSQCPHCGVSHPLLFEKARFRTTDFQQDYNRQWVAYSCSKCGLVTTAYSYADNGDVEEIYPAFETIDTSVPSKAKSFLEQAINSIHAPSGSIMLCASSVDAMLKEKGYKEGKLFSRINRAAEDHLITNSIAEWAHQVRLDANDERHADDDSLLPSESDARKCINFTKALAEYLFVLPSKVNRGIKDAKENP